MQEEPEIIKTLREEEQLGKLCTQWLNAYQQLILPEKPTKKQSSDVTPSNHQPPAYPTTDLRKIYQIVFENSAVAIMLTNENEQIISWNKYAEDLLGMKKDDLHLKSVKSLYPKDEWKKIRAENVRQKGMQHHLETKMIRKNDSLLDVDISLSVLKNRDGRVVGSIGVIKDISKQKQVERELKQSEEKFKQLYEKAPIPYHTLSPKGEITNVSDKWCQILGYKKEEIIGRSIFGLIAEDERGVAKASFEEKIRSKQTYTGGHERAFITKNGERHIFVINDFFSVDEWGNVSSVHTTMEDITHRKEIEEKLKNSEKRFRDISHSMADWIWEVD
ncbi:MAG: PAS domain-containing protein, partial [Candidatus Thermoplasmatota archaeon]|nr:PAS domain-containing protein [Candidatus Thermoplasmatota archaeon]